MIPKVELKDKSVYVKVYFRIEAGYVWGQGMSKEQVMRFDEEVRAILTSIGFDRWRVNNGRDTCSEGYRGIERLYCHPMELTGEVKKDAIDEIVAAISKATTFRFRNADLYEEGYNFTEEELRMELEVHRDRLEEKILSSYRTKRRNLYKKGFYSHELRSDISFIKDKRELVAIEGQFMHSLFDELVASGRIIKAEGHDLYRTRSKNDPPIAA